MHLESRVTWKKLCLELELMAGEDPVSIVPVLIGVNALLANPEAQEWCCRQINFMSYELQSRSLQMPEFERFELLNKYIFSERGFQMLPNDQACLDSEFLFKGVLANRRGSGLTIALIYMHLAADLEIPVTLLHVENHLMLKWVRSGRASYIDLNNHGSLLTEAEMLAIIHRNHAVRPHEDLLEGWKAPAILRAYVCHLLKIYENSHSWHHVLICLNILLKLSPNNIKMLGERALVRRRLGFGKEALMDLKRYFSFVDSAQAPQELRVALHELEALLKISPEADETVH
jgi:regulator of sirC expression with transglutaminase-like and TPR domain